MIEMDEIEARKEMHALGGTIKIGEFLKVVERRELDDYLFEYLKDVSQGKKIFFGISSYCSNLKVSTLGGELKSRLKEAGISARHVTSREPKLSSVVVAKNKLLTRGAEFLLIPNGEKVTIGKTLAVQEFEEFSYRDFGRPSREMEVGLLPPKVARIMINLSGVDKEAALLDPFCGFGTVATEAMIMGYKNIFASDLEKFAVDGTQKNIEWIKKHFPETAGSDVKIFQSPAEEISKHFKKREIDTVVTEPYLGPVQKRALQEAEAKKLIVELSKIYFDSLRDWEKVLKPGGRVVMIFPAFMTNKGLVSIPVAEELKKLPYDILPLLPPEATRLPFLRRQGYGGQDIKTSPQGGLIYQRPEQKVVREIYILRLNK